MAKGYGWARGFSWSCDDESNDIRVVSILNVHDEIPRLATRAEKNCICQGVGYMSRKRQIDRRFLHRWLHCDSIFVQMIISSIFSKTNFAKAVTSAQLFTHTCIKSCLWLRHGGPALTSAHSFLLILTWNHDCYLISSFISPSDESLRGPSLWALAWW